MGLRSRVSWSRDFNTEEFAHMANKCCSISRMALFRSFRKEIAKNLTWPSRANQDILHAAFSSRLVSFDAGQRWSMDCTLIPDDLPGNSSDQFRSQVLAPKGLA